MKIVQLYYPLHASLPGMPDGPQVMAIGDFDGVHLGHRKVIGRAVEMARQEHLTAAVMTFHPHPREILGSPAYAHCLTPVHDKMNLFSELGVEVAYVVAFDHALSRVTPDMFVRHMLDPMNIRTVVVGFDFTFGRGGAGNADTLRQLCEPRIRVDVIPPHMLDGRKVSSTLIREQLAEGRVDLAARYLGEPYTLKGLVERGEGRGRTIGFPTANLHLTAPYVLPRTGVYAVRAVVGESCHNGVMNIGVKPTFGERDAPTIEVHLFDFSGDLYGRSMQVQLIGYLRPERRFSSAGELVEQIRRDADEARHLLSTC
jgi:riboflavin kinase/FMN adenylyltransferase